MSLRFEPNMVIDGSSLGPHKSGTYESAVRDDLLSLMMFETGRAVVDEIGSRSHRRLLFTPYVPTAALGFQNATTTPWNARDASENGNVLYDNTTRHIREDWGGGTGRGTDVHIRYSPSFLGNDTRLYRLYRLTHNMKQLWQATTGTALDAPGNDRGEMLLHEMVHALTFMAGHGSGWNPLYDGLRSWDDEEEFRAVMVTNIYSSERGRPLRSSHASGRLMPSPVIGQTHPVVQKLLLRFRAAMSGLTDRLRLIDTPFNPFRNNYGTTDAM